MGVGPGRMDGAAADRAVPPVGRKRVRPGAEEAVNVRQKVCIFVRIEWHEESPNRRFAQGEGA